MVTKNAVVVVVLIFTCCCIGEVIGQDASKDVVSVTCPTYAPDVQYKPVTVECSVHVHFATGVYFYSIDAYMDSKYPQRLPASGDSYFNNGNNKSITDVVSKVTFSLHQYETDGVYTVNMWAQSFNTPQVQALANFTIRKTLNDEAPPVLVYSKATSYADQTFPSPPQVQMSLTDDLSGIVRVSASMSNGEVDVASAMWTFTPNGTSSKPPTKLNITLTLSATPYTSEGTFRLSLSYTDAIGQSAGNWDTYLTIGPYDFNPNYVVLTCPQTWFDVSDKDASFNCSMKVKSDNGINNYNISASTWSNNSYVSIRPVNPDYSGANLYRNIIPIFWKIPKNQANGTYTVYVSASGNGTSVSAQATINIYNKGPTCTCPAGYVCNGSSCVDIDECKRNATICMDGQTCVNAPGNYSCNDVKYYITSRQTGYVLTANNTGNNVYMSPQNGQYIRNQLWNFVPGKGGFIMSPFTGYVCDVQYGNPFAGAAVIEWTQNSPYSNNQQWTYNSTSSTFTSKAGSFVLDVKQASTAPGTPVLLYYPKGTDNANQQFALTPTTY